MCLLASILFCATSYIAAPRTTVLGVIISLSKKEPLHSICCYALFVSPASSKTSGIFCQPLRLVTEYNIQDQVLLSVFLV